ncbi:MAG: ribonuclease HII [Bacteroidaceae bacterium]|nr:ribonuclease HII [Bacteroidaceae bacterium]
MELAPFFKPDVIEAGCDEAGRGCLAGSVYAAAVILPTDYHNDKLNDSKQLTAKQRYALREEIQRDAIAWSLGIVTAQEIDEMNILRASITAMHRAIDGLKVRPQHLIIDGNRFYPYHNPAEGDNKGDIVPHQTIVKGDGKYLSIAAASILAKTYRDDYMKELHQEYPYYGWDHNAGYPTKEHRKGIEIHGTTPYHRMTFNLLGNAQLELNFHD